MEPLTQMTTHLSVFSGNINVGILWDNDRVLLIDTGDGRVGQFLHSIGRSHVSKLLFTHHHRDQVCGVMKVASEDTELVVPEAERAWFENVESYWNSNDSRWHIYNVHPHHLMLAESVRVTRGLSNGDSMTWGSARITAIATPGHTDGSLSYLVEVDDRRIIFTGDLIYADGQIWEQYSLQKGNSFVTDYHGFLGSRDEVVASLRTLLSLQANVWVPSHGIVMHNPVGAATALISRVQQCYDTYASISALRWYFPDMFADNVNASFVMPIRQGTPHADCLRHVETSWILRSETGAAFVMDCGGASVVDTLKQWLKKGEISAVEGIWITHTHDDHVDAVPLFQQEFDCELVADESVAIQISDPKSWRFPCLSPSVSRVDRITRHGESWQWHEFTMTAFRFPGQALYHGGLLVEGQGHRMFFAGDSFTPAGIDDYCVNNRNFLGSNQGFVFCLDLLEQLAPTEIYNCHVDVAFDFTPAEYSFMRKNLESRLNEFGALFPWDNPNFGLDEAWARCCPYEQSVSPGDTTLLSVIITNHGKNEARGGCWATLPTSWGGSATELSSASIPGNSVQEMRLQLTVPPDTVPGRYVIPVDITFGERNLPQFTEAIVVVGAVD